MIIGFRVFINQQSRNFIIVSDSLDPKRKTLRCPHEQASLKEVSLNFLSSKKSKIQALVHSKVPETVPYAAKKWHYLNNRFFLKP